MKRDRWEFQFTTEELAKAVSNKVEFHSGRVEFWNKAKEAAIAEAKQGGITISESDANYGSNATRAMTPQVMIDQTFQRRIAEAHQKIELHSEKMNEFEGWAQVFDANKGRSLELTADDYLFFFGK